MDVTYKQIAFVLVDKELKLLHMTEYMESLVEAPPPQHGAG